MDRLVSVVIPTKSTTPAGATQANAGPNEPATGKKWNIWTGYL